jgi:hypothetical protein
MKFILLVYMCIAGTCESVYEQKLYDSWALCQQSAEETKTYLMQKFPVSSGEIYCLTEEEFEKYQNYYGQTKGV